MKSLPCCFVASRHADVFNLLLIHAYQIPVVFQNLKYKHEADNKPFDLCLISLIPHVKLSCVITECDWRSL